MSLILSRGARGPALRRLVPPCASSQQPTLQQRQFSSNDAAEVDNNRGVYPVYVHHLSKVVLEYLQESRHDWVVRHGLDGGLKLRANGTFVLQFPPRQDEDSDPGRIWTSYDSVSKKHWLSVSRESLIGRFMLRDNTKNSDPAQFNPELVRKHVDKMIKVIDEMETAGAPPKKE